MKNILIIILFLVSTFIVNIFAYYSSESYRDFIKRVKNEASKEVEIEKNDFTKTGDNGFFNTDNSGKVEVNLDPKQTEQNPNRFSDNTAKNDNNEETEEIKLGGTYKEILEMFSEYDFRQVKLNVNLFDLTNEYPDKYLEYYSSKVVIYFFTTKSYTAVYDIFDVLQVDYRFKINPLNNFGEKSFYINLDEDIKDNYIRLVVSYKGITFGLKIDSNEYNKIKTKLQTLK